MHRAILCIGSNVEHACHFIEKAVAYLRESGTDVIKKSDIYTVSMPYYNCVALILTELDQHSLIEMTKEIETEMGRTQAMKAKSMVPIDIDVVVFDDIMLRPDDYSADYFQLGYSCMENFREDI